MLTHFTTNRFTEKNPTLVNFPIKNLDMKQYTELPDNSVDALSKLPVAELKKYARSFPFYPLLLNDSRTLTCNRRLAKKKIDYKGVTEKDGNHTYTYCVTHIKANSTMI
jgi:hypothetical protein